ncbi:lipid A export ATP-binding/permease msbA [Coprinopsis cinerea AmutBmut pab1-1]|nr:lipid A export ATP-binding/permease msbA [Coprinopsis cinerea AmutBmut pab1-1]
MWTRMKTLRNPTRSKSLYASRVHQLSIVIPQFVPPNDIAEVMLDLFPRLTNVKELEIRSPPIAPHKAVIEIMIAREGNAKIFGIPRPDQTLAMPALKVLILKSDYRWIHLGLGRSTKKLVIERPLTALQWDHLLNYLDGIWTGIGVNPWLAVTDLTITINWFVWNAPKWLGKLGNNLVNITQLTIFQKWCPIPDFISKMASDSTMFPRLEQLNLNPGQFQYLSCTKETAEQMKM